MHSQLLFIFNIEFNSIARIIALPCPARYHLDFSSLLCSLTLSQPPCALDCAGSHILIASQPLDIALYAVQLKV